MSSFSLSWHVQGWESGKKTDDTWEEIVTISNNTIKNKQNLHINDCLWPTPTCKDQCWSLVISSVLSGPTLVYLLIHIDWHQAQDESIGVDYKYDKHRIVESFGSTAPAPKVPGQKTQSCHFHTHSKSQQTIFPCSSDGNAQVHSLTRKIKENTPLNFERCNIMRCIGCTNMQPKCCEMLWKFQVSHLSLLQALVWVAQLAQPVQRAQQQAPEQVHQERCPKGLGVWTV